MFYIEVGGLGFGCLGGLVPPTLNNQNNQPCINTLVKPSEEVWTDGSVVKVLAAPPERLGLIPSTRMVSYSHL